MDLFTTLYGKENINIRNSVWQKGFKKGQMDNNHSMTPEIVDWLDKAIDTYYRKRIYHILDQVEKNSTTNLSVQWKDLMIEMYGDSEDLKNAVIDAAQKDLNVGIAAREWVKHQQ